MNAHPANLHAARSPLPAEQLTDALKTAANAVAPLWPLKHFVAVNPYLGVTDRDFRSAAHIMAQTAGSAMTLDRGFYLDALAEGRITEADLAAALAEAEGDVPKDVAGFKQALDRQTQVPPKPLPTVADLAEQIGGKTWPAFVTDRISSWAGAFYDEGQAGWAAPDRDQPAFTAWIRQARLDRTPEIMGLKGVRAVFRQLPEDAYTAAGEILNQLNLQPEALPHYLQRLVRSVGGWAAYARYLVWQAELYGGSDDSVVQILVIRLAWDLALLKSLSSLELEQAWAEARFDFADPAPQPGLDLDLVLQAAFDKAFQRDLLAKVNAPRSGRGQTAVPAVQAAFCIDVRSEILRRALESVEPEVETIGFAGFFGIPIEYVPIGEEEGGAHAPVLLTPGFRIAESAGDKADPALTEKRGVNRALLRAWKRFKMGAVSSFAFVETLGFSYLVKLTTDSLGLTRPVTDPNHAGLDKVDAKKLGPSLEPGHQCGHKTGMTAEERLATAEAILKAMSMTGPFANLVLLVGHGSTTVNNPHATGLDCGACGGHTGEASARVAAKLLNDPAVRAGLKARGIAIPDSSHVLAGLHDTCTDEVTLYDTDTVPETLKAELSHLKAKLAAAAKLARAERAALLNLPDTQPVDGAVKDRAKDWSQVRPEWGLAGCGAFIAAPRRRTQGLSLGGRSFLHSYDWQADEGFGVLELIMTAPMVVASWISLQYYGSSVDNRTFGSGNKTLHNVVGRLGVLEGNGGDLRTGLPLQSVHDGEKLVHEPVRLNVVIEAPIEAMNAIIEKHAMVRDLLDNGWLTLFHMDADGRIAQRYAGGLTWLPCLEPAASADAA